MPEKRKIAVITTSRADYSHLYWPLRDLAAHPDVDLRLIVLGSHLSPEFGSTVQGIEKDGFKIDARIECLLSSDTDIGMAKTIGLATLSLADHLGATRPDLLLLIADRYEMLAPASVAVALRIPVAHIEGGEISQGAIDDAVRNALTKMAHVHFTSTETARLRVIAMGEESWRVHRAGAPSLDHLRRGTLMSRGEVEELLHLDLSRPTILISYHPVTIARHTVREADALFAALGKIEAQLLFCFPNADAGSRELQQRTRGFLANRDRGRVFTNLDPRTYWSLLAQVDLLLGNSSSGIMESASFTLPTVNVGMRQQGRERARNVIDVDPDESVILRAVQRARDPEFRAELAGMENPYGSGNASETIVRVLVTVPLSEQLLVKQAAPLPPPGPGKSMTSLRIPLSAPDITEAEIAAVANVLRTPQLSLGPKLEAFERAAADYVGADYAVAVNSGTSGLHLCIRCLGIGEGDQVIVPSFTFIAAANVVRMERATPVFVDIDPTTLNLDPLKVEAAITPRTRAILVVHTFGRPADMTALLTIAKRHHLRVIEDACEAIGAEDRGRKVGAIGDAGVFAFYPNKQITTGEGGMIVTNDASLAAMARALRNQGRENAGEWLEHSHVGYNYRLSEMQCVLGLEQLHRVEEILMRRAEVAAWYDECLRANPDVATPELYIPHGRISWFVYAVRLSGRFQRHHRDAIVAALRELGIGCGRYFAPIHLQPAYRDLPKPKDPLTVTEQVGQRSIALPFFNRISRTEVHEVCQSLQHAIREISG